MKEQTSKSDCADHIYELSVKIVAGASLEEALEFIFDSFESLVPYDRIGFAEVDDSERVVHAKWARSTGSIILRNGYSAPLKDSSLSIVLELRRPRVLNNLPEYLANRPESRSTKLIVSEGIRSSMTCPLFIRDKPVGFLFFSSSELNAYTEAHVTLLKDLSVHLAMLLMASQSPASPPRLEETADQPTVRPPVAQRPSRQSGARQETYFVSQLKPGMRLAEPISFGIEGLWLAAGTELTRTSIERLMVLREQDMLSSSAVEILCHSPGT